MLKIFYFINKFDIKKKKNYLLNVKLIIIYL